MNDPKEMGWPRELDPALYDHYAKKLPLRGWAGEKTAEEREYIRKVKQSKVPQSKPCGKGEGDANS